VDCVNVRENDLIIDATGKPWRIDVEDDPELFPVPSLWAYQILGNPDIGQNLASLPTPWVLIYRAGEPRDRVVGE
jgi:hypothetical protein